MQSLKGLKAASTSDTLALAALIVLWQGNKDSNLGMPESKSGALTNLAIPLHNRMSAVSALNVKPLNVRLILDYDLANEQVDGA